MIQGGDPNTKGSDRSLDGTGGMGDRLKAEFNEASHKRGVCSMARTNDPNSATSQFFICHGAATFLDKQYTIWGQLVEGYNVMDKIVDLDKNPKYQKGPDSSINPGKDAQMTKVYIQEAQ
jgi:cyclophilin family peptidyl-prolyl cis-trans isomerase